MMRRYCSDINDFQYSNIILYFTKQGKYLRLRLVCYWVKHKHTSLDNKIKLTWNIVEIEWIGGIGRDEAALLGLAQLLRTAFYCSLNGAVWTSGTKLGNNRKAIVSTGIDGPQNAWLSNWNLENHIKTFAWPHQATSQPPLVLQSFNQTGIWGGKLTSKPVYFSTLQKRREIGKTVGRLASYRLWRVMCALLLFRVPRQSVPKLHETCNRQIKWYEMLPIKKHGSPSTRRCRIKRHVFYQCSWYLQYREPTKIRKSSRKLT